MHARLFLPRLPVLPSLTSPNFLAFATHCYRKSDIQAIFEYHALYSAPCILHPDVADSGGLKVASRVCLSKRITGLGRRRSERRGARGIARRLCQCRECNERYCNINNRISADRVAESCRCSYCCCRGTVCDRGMSAS